MKNIVTSFILTAFAAVTAQADWSEPVRISEPGSFRYSHIIAKGDTLHVVYMNWNAGHGIGYVRSTDGGNTWSREVELSDVTATSVSASPKIMIFGSNLLVVWRIYFRSGYDRLNIAYAISHNYGNSWSAPDYILPSNWNYINSIGASNNDSVVNVIFPSSDTLFYSARSTNFGATWSAPQELFRVAQSLIPDQVSAGNMVHFSWDGLFRWEDTPEVFYLRSTDRGLTWSNSRPISSVDQFISEVPAIAADESGNPAISWWDFKYSPYQLTGDILCRWSTDQGVTWGPENQVTTNHFADLSDIVWSDDTIRVVWQDFRFDPFRATVYYRSVFDSIPVWGPEERLENGSEASMFPSMAINNGHVYVVWYDARCAPDTDLCGGIYFTRNYPFPDAIEEVPIPNNTGVLEAYPNPFNSSTTITYSNLKEGGEISIYNLMGQKIKTFTIESGKEGKIAWDATDASGNKVSSGIYFAKASASQKAYTIKLLYLR